MPPSILYCSEGDLEELMSIEGKVALADDDDTGGINQSVSLLTVANPNQQRFVTRALNWGTDRVNFFCLTLYAASDLATSDMVNQWATICAAWWFSHRRGNPPPGAYEELYKDTIADLKSVKSGENQIPDIGYREVQWPAWSNIHVSTVYQLKRSRVERPISEKTPTTYPQNVDHVADFIYEP
ncbi:MAG: hypothetical protein KGL39_07910 [Patescibacteria group bacterium]|nr:hypothetical protein [Patescibacteria group bacterium]